MANFPAVQGMGGSLQDALVEKSKVQTSASGNMQHVRYDSYSGDWSFGKDNEDITGAEVTIITNSITHGWHRWADREVVKRMANFTEDLPEKIEPIEDRKGKMQTANEARGFQCVLDVDSDEGSIQMSWEHSTDGCRRAIDAILDATRARALDEADFLFPVVLLKNDTPYENSYKDGEMIYPPMLEITGWRNQEGEMAGDTVAKVEDKSSKKKAKAEPEEANDDDEDEEPKKRTRQRRRA